MSITLLLQSVLNLRPNADERGLFHDTKLAVQQAVELAAQLPVQMALFLRLRALRPKHTGDFPRDSADLRLGPHLQEGHGLLTSSFHSIGGMSM